MTHISRLTCLLAALIICLGFSAPKALAEGGNTPESAAKGFTHAYYTLDASIGDYLSTDARTDENEVDMVELFFNKKEAEARGRGYKISYLKMHPLLIKTEVVEQTEDTATVRVNTSALRSINPVFRMVGWVFGLIDEHNFETTLPLVKEDGMWKVGPGALVPMG
ncbi:MAG: hypothetical protein MI802_14075 [Desulfobacterales bacterium]|nr:hypothetical protein [Desulfobacterales bacterium]